MIFSTIKEVNALLANFINLKLFKHIVINDIMLKRDKDFDILASLFVCSVQFSNSEVILSRYSSNWSGKNLACA